MRAYALAAGRRQVGSQAGDGEHPAAGDHVAVGAGMEEQRVGGVVAEVDERARSAGAAG